jgi:two-component system LytT family sensor kinase
MKKSVILTIHFVFWIVVYWIDLTLINQFHRLMSMEMSSEFHALIITISCIVPVYLAYFTYPYLFIPKKNILFILLIFLILISYSTTAIIFDDGLEGLSLKNLLSVVPIFAVAMLAGIGLRSLIDFIDQKKKHDELEKQTIRSELSLLKSQLNPHFLFNTLHNIDALIYENQKAASASLIILSDMMRYMLQEAKKDLVELEKELKNLNNYIDLEKLRLKNEAFLKYDISESKKGLRIAPMMLLPFVENAFKHSVDSVIEEGITIKIHTENNTLYFFCENKFEAQVFEKDKTPGIGLETVKKRLDLLYPDKHKLDIFKDDSLFRFNLEIELYEN